MERWNKGASEDNEGHYPHAVRHQVKTADPRTLTLIGYTELKVALSGLKIEDGMLSFSLRAETDTPQKLQLDYAICFNGRNNRMYRKLHRLSQRMLKPKADYQRKIHASWLQVEILANSKVLGGVDC